MTNNFPDAQNYKKLIYIADNKKQFNSYIMKSLKERSNNIKLKRKICKQS